MEGTDMKLGIITPIGPGHEKAYEECRRSIEVAWSHNPGRFSELEIFPMWDLEGMQGRSARRNDGIDLAKQKGCDWIFFLDADDLLSQFAFEEVAPYLDDYDAVWGNICEMPYGHPEYVKLREDQLEATEDFEDLLKFDPSLTLQMGHFVRPRCADAVRFDTDMNVGEDFKYYLGLCQQYRFAKVPGIFFINQRGMHSQGPRAGVGRDWESAVQNEIRNAIARRGLIARVALDGKESQFRITNPFDIIQMHLCRGFFFEQNELLTFKKMLGEGKVIVDVGANIGNHTIFFVQHMNPRKVFPFEPNPDSVRLLKENLQLNQIGSVVDSAGIGLGLGADYGQYSVESVNENNLGAARLVKGGAIKVKPLDAVIPKGKVDFIKIDVEGMEFEVLKGAEKLIARSRPLIYVEVFNERTSMMRQWADRHAYVIVGQVNMVNAVNYLLASEELVQRIRAANPSAD